jgi:hypothetical protein
MHYIAIIAVLGGAMTLVLILGPKITVTVLGTFVFLVPLSIHFYFLAAGLVSGVILKPPFLLLVSMTMCLVALRLHRSALKRRLMGTASGHETRSPSERQ